MIETSAQVHVRFPALSLSHLVLVILLTAYFLAAAMRLFVNVN